MDWVKWFRDRADRNRHQEEVKILEAEFGRTIVSHRRMAKVWGELAGRSKLGAAAYAHKKVEMYRKLQNDCETAYKTAKVTAVKL